MWGGPVANMFVRTMSWNWVARTPKFLILKEPTSAGKKIQFVRETIRQTRHAVWWTRRTHWKCGATVNRSAPSQYYPPYLVIHALDWIVTWTSCMCAVRKILAFHVEICTNRFLAIIAYKLLWLFFITLVLTHQPILSSIQPSIHTSIYTLIHPSILTSIHSSAPIHLFIYLYPPIHPPIYLTQRFICASICWSSPN